MSDNTGPAYARAAEGGRVLAQAAVAALVLLLCYWAWRRFLVACKDRLGISERAPTWFIWAKLFPKTFPQVVGLIWSAIGLIPCENLIAAFGYFNEWGRRGVWTFRNQEGAQGLVALTIDDAPARPHGRSLMDVVLPLLAEYNATCSFFVVSTFMEGREAEMRQAVEAGHELCNHGGKDVPYHRHTKEAFQEVLLACEAKIDKCLDDVNAASPSPSINRCNNKWFRPPHAKMSPAMEQVLAEEGFRIAMSDCYGMDVMCRPPFIANYTARHAQAGSIVLLHMPEEGFREYNLESIRGALAGLAARGLRCVSLSELEDACRGPSGPKCD